MPVKNGMHIGWKLHARLACHKCRHEIELHASLTTRFPKYVSDAIT